MRGVLIQTSSLHTTSYSMQTSLDQLQVSLSKFKQIKAHANVLSAPLANEVFALYRKSESLRTKLVRIDHYIKESGILYEQMEQRLRTKAQQLSFGQSQANGLVEAAKSTSLLFTSAQVLLQQSQTSNHTKTTNSQYGKWKVDAMHHYFDSSHNASLSRGIHSLLLGGIRGSIETGGYLVGISRADKFFGLLNQAHFTIGNVALSGSAKGVLFQNKKFQPELQAEVNASISAATGLISSRWRNDIMEAKASAKVDVGTAGVKAKAVINQEEITIKGEVGAAAAHGEVKGVINILGVTITATAEGELGGVGVKGNFSTTSNSFEIGGKISCLLGGGVNVKFEW